MPTYNKILEHPFINQLIDGSLERPKFNEYIRQDALYLAEYGKVLAGIAAKLNDLDDSHAFLGFAKDSILVERSLHETFMQTADTSHPAEPSPACLLYTSYLHSLHANGGLHEALAGVLPCFWIYQEVGNHILANQRKDGNPYQAWIDTYAGEEFAAAVQQAISICNKAATRCTPHQQEQMTAAFARAAKLEWMFWNSAYHLKTWEV